MNIFDEMAFIDEGVRAKLMGLINGNCYSDEEVEVLLNKKPVFIEQQVYSETISSLIDFLSNEGIGNVGGINHNVIIESPSALSEYNRDILIEIFKFGKLPNGKTFNKRGVKVIIVDDNKDFYSMF